MKISRKIVFIIIFLLLSISSIIYFLYPKSGSADSFLFKDLSRDSVTKILVYSYNLKEDRKIEDKIKIQELLAQLSEINLKECSDNISINNKDAYDLIFSNKNGYVSKDGTKKISELQITLYNKGYIVLCGEGNLKSKYFKIDNPQEIQKLNDFIAKF